MERKQTGKRKDAKERGGKGREEEQEARKLKKGAEEGIWRRFDRWCSSRL